MATFGKNGTAEELERKIEEFFRKFDLEKAFNEIVGTDKVNQMVRTQYESTMKRIQRIIDEAPEEIKATVESMVQAYKDYSLEMFTSHFHLLLKLEIYEDLSILMCAVDEVAPEDEDFKAKISETLKLTLQQVIDEKEIREKLQHLEDSYEEFCLNELISRAVTRHIPSSLKDLIEAMTESGIGVALGVIMPTDSNKQDDSEE